MINLFQNSKEKRNHVMFRIDVPIISHPSKKCVYKCFSQNHLWRNIGQKLPLVLYRLFQGTFLEFDILTYLYLQVISTDRVKIYHTSNSQICVILLQTYLYGSKQLIKRLKCLPFFVIFIRLNNYEKSMDLKNFNRNRYFH